MQSPRLIEKHRFLFLFIVMVIFFLAKSLSGEVQLYDFTSFILLCLIIYSLYVISHKRGFILFAAVFTAVCEVFFVLADQFFKMHTLAIAKTSFAALFFAVMTYACFISVTQDKKISTTTLFGSLCTYFFIGLFWAYLYLCLQTIDSGAFSGIMIGPNTENEFIYYSFVTLTTLGYGDVLPAANIAKTVSWLEAYIGQAYLTLLMAQLVGRYISRKE